MLRVLTVALALMIAIPAVASVQAIPAPVPPEPGTPVAAAGPSQEPRPAPLGGESWKTSRVLLPETLRNRAFRSVFTGAEVKPIETAEQSWIFLGQVFDRLPVAMIRTS